MHLGATWWRLPHPDVVPAFFALEGPMIELAKRGRKGGDQAQLAVAGRTLSTALLLQFLIHEVCSLPIDHVRGCVGEYSPLQSLFFFAD